MPPKKKETKKKRKKNSAAKKMDEPTIEEKYQQTIQKIESLQDHLVMRTEIARRSQLQSSDLREKVKEANENISDERKSKYDISSDLIRQYKSMQTQLTNKIYSLEGRILLLTDKLTNTEEKLAFEKADKQKIIIEKDDVIADLEHKLDHMEIAYENILHDSFDMIVEKLDEAKKCWKNEAIEIQSKNKALLLEFGLNPLDV